MCGVNCAGFAWVGKEPVQFALAAGKCRTVFAVWTEPRCSNWGQNLLHYQVQIAKLFSIAFDFDSDSSTFCTGWNNFMLSFEEEIKSLPLKLKMEEIITRDPVNIDQGCLRYIGREWQGKLWLCNDIYLLPEHRIVQNVMDYTHESNHSTAGNTAENIAGANRSAVLPIMKLVEMRKAFSYRKGN